MSDSLEKPSPDPDPLEMARNCVAAVARIADYQERDPLQAYTSGAGAQGMQTAKLAACMALVSIAQDLRRIADQAF